MVAVTMDVVAELVNPGDEVGLGETQRQAQKPHSAKPRCRHSRDEVHRFVEDLGHRERRPLHSKPSTKTTITTMRRLTTQKSPVAARMTAMVATSERPTTDDRR
jgi:hypothetical protein